MKKYAIILLAISLLGVGILRNKQFLYKILASPITNFSQTINAGTLSVDIVDDSYDSVSSPSVSMSAVTFSFACQEATGTFGTSTERIYVQNPDAADGGWTVSLAGSSPTAVWASAGTSFDFNEAGSSGCIDDGVTTDADNYGGQMSVDPSAGILNVGQCSSCVVTNVSKGSSNAFVQGSVNTITILDAAAGSDDIGDWYLTDVDIVQKVPAEQPVASDYNINMVLSIVAK